ncbi:CheR family methyltransferase [Methylobacterium radiodurans]|uniref:protein-glutamate O-methyltransferase n=1 Tax=Methylobacterium radiodurans TaxID=2202828 RepID=A0A2U8VUC5_9HYPH|nr:CheR family methyltransferase [Methylobacterium radiodurans]AWN37071.1 protein-glutamate methyltransferase [Methylobacterium radiodurans]
MREPGSRDSRISLAADPGYGALKARIIARTGHHYYADKDDLLSDRLRRRFRALGVADAAAYAALLERAPEEWTALEAEITIGETFFFRYAEQFAALRGTILPDILAARAAERTLRIWSAGCSTGAEPYSLAILVHELLGPALPDWQVTILGTDISAAALETARAAEYGRWALRTSPPEERMRYFRAVPPQPGAARESGYALREAYRRLVRFERRNLLELLGAGAPPHLDGFDLILCRNVLIYFDAETVAALMRAFGARLRGQGWLLIGHAEPNPAFAGWLDAVSLPGTVAYRRPGEARPEVVPTKPWQPTALPDLPPARPDPLPDVPPAPSPSEDGVLRARESVPPPSAPPAGAAAPGSGTDAEIDLETDPETVLAEIRARADAGESGAAWRALGAALAVRPTDPRLRFYEGLIAASLGREAEAERAFRGAIYLDPGFVMAHHHLGLLLAGLGRAEAARLALDNALRLSQALPPEMVLREGDGATAAEIAAGARAARDGIGR